MVSFIHDDTLQEEDYWLHWRMYCETQIVKCNVQKPMDYVLTNVVEHFFDSMCTHTLNIFRDRNTETRIWITKMKTSSERWQRHKWNIKIHLFLLHLSELCFFILFLNYFSADYYYCIVYCGAQKSVSPFKSFKVIVTVG